MPYTCPAGHQSESADHCDTCGAPIDGSTTSSPIPATAEEASPEAAPATATTVMATADTDAGAEWSAMVEADRSFFDANEAVEAAEAVPFPTDLAPRHVPLTGEGDVLIGRRSDSEGVLPEIDLGVPAADPGVSRRHALLRRQEDGGWVVIDQGSTNGTRVNEAAEPIRPGQPAPLRDGDRVHVGAWTRITLRRSTDVTSAPGEAT